MLVRFELTKDGFRCIDAPVIANAVSINYLIAEFTISDDMWADVSAITAIFKSATYNKVSEVILGADNRCYVDPEIYKKGGTIQVKLVGDKYQENRIISSTNVTEVIEFFVKENVITPTPVPDKYEVVVAELVLAEQAVEDVIETVQTKLDNGDFDGADGADGVGITSISYNQDGTLDITLTDGTSFTSEYSMKGATGATGNGIALIDYGEDGTVIITMTDGTQFVSEYSMKGEKGDPGEDGNGIIGIMKTGTSGLVDTYTIEFSDETTTDFTVTNGEKGDPGTTDYNDLTNKPDLFSGSYNDLTDKPSIPSKTSDLTNDSNFPVDANYVHTDNNYTSAEKTKLSGIADGAEVNVQSDWSQSDNTKDDYIKNKPSIPSKTSDLTNDSNFVVDATYVHTDNNFTSALKSRLELAFIYMGSDGKFYIAD